MQVADGREDDPERPQDRTQRGELFDELPPTNRETLRRPARHVVTLTQMLRRCNNKYGRAAGQAADPARVATFAFSADVLALGILAWPRKLGGGKRCSRI